MTNMDIADETVEMQVWYKDPLEGEWVVRLIMGEKTESDIARIVGESFEWDIPIFSPMYIVQDIEGDPVTLVEYLPFQSIFVNYEEVRKSDKG